MLLPEMPERSVQCCVTSPPYWGLRDYGVDRQIGLEASPENWVAEMVAVFGQVRRVLRDDGTLWLNVGDAYAGGRRGGNPSPSSSTLQGSNATQEASMVKRAMCSSRRRDNAEIPRSDVRVEGLKPKDLIGLPWMLAFALRADGWYLRSDIIWHKPNPMPESVQDRPTKAHEYVFLLSKSERYHYDAKAIYEPVTGNAHSRGDGLNPKSVVGWASGPGLHTAIAHAQSKQNPSMTAAISGPNSKRMPKTGGTKHAENGHNRTASGNAPEWVEARNARSVWTISTQGYSGAHFATFPRELAARCIKAGCPAGGLVLDPFAGTGTTIAEAVMLGRRGVGIELNPEYARLAEQRIDEQCGLLAGVTGGGA